MVWLRDKARPYTAHKTTLCLKDLGVELLAHPPYSPDLAARDFHLFGPLKVELQEKHFSSDEEAIKAMQN